MHWLPGVWELLRLSGRSYQTLGTRSAQDSVQQTRRAIQFKQATVENNVLSTSLITSKQMESVLTSNFSIHDIQVTSEECTSESFIR